VLAALFLILALGHLPAFALFDDYNHPELKWLSFETDHFVVYYTEGLEDVASMAAKVAEDVHGPLCKLYDYVPDTKVSLIFSDADDIANAATYFQSNKIHFYATSMAWDFRGTHNWLRNVVTHEYTHMIQLGAARKWARRVPALYAQFLGYEPERRPDVLYGYPNRLVSWPLPSVTVPAWFAEGVAQFQFTGNGYDYWDSHRDMLLRQSTLSHRLLSFEDMAYFGKTSLESEGVYNQGFSFVRYVAKQTGDTKSLERISQALSSLLPLTMDAAMKRATGKSGNDWYREWRASLEREYGATRDELSPTLTRADTVPVKGYVNLYPRLSPDGKQVAFISNQKRDYFGQTSLYIYNFETAKAELVAPAAHSGLCWLPDGSGVLFTRQQVRVGTGSLQHDIYLYQVKSKKTLRLSNGVRAESVDISPDGKTLVFTVNEQGRREIAFASMPDVSKKPKPITPETLLYRHPSLPHEQYYLPRWSRDGKFIAVAQNLYDGRGLRIFEVQDGGRGMVLKQEFSGENLELRDAAWTADSKSLLVSWDVSGIANIYRLNLADSSRQQLTSVLGGAYYPDMQGDRLVYSDFCGQGYRICSLGNPSALSIADPPPPGGNYALRVPKPDFTVTAERHVGKLYKPAFENLYWFPRIAFDYGTFKPGVYVLLNDVLEKLNFLGGFAINEKKDYDLFGSVEYRALYPTIFAEYYNVQRNLSQRFSDSTRITGEDPNFQPIYDTYGIKYRYNLNEIEAGVKLAAGKGTYGKLSGVYDRYTAHNRFDDGSTVGLTYFKGWAGKLGFYTDQRRPGVASEINPSGGFKGYLELTRANQLFFTGFDIAGSTIGLKEAYAPYNYDMIEGGAEKYFQLPGWDHTLELRARGGAVDRHVDPFFFLYAGGLPGMRGYSFYSLGGERIGVGTATYRFPIVRRADWNLWPLSVNRIYGSLFADVGSAWKGDVHPGGIKKDIGAGLRVQLHSFYSYPTAIAFDAAYGFDKFSVTETGRTPTEYGKEMRYYLTVLFDFYSPFAGHGTDLGSSAYKQE
jgi:Tol biopolymer transport system component